ncbi:MAG: hypothetical protein HYS23_00385 [Geobacter sp.]|nr:hypothetical protein [Geobacter sp.]
MKKRVVVGIALALGVLAAGVSNAAACGACGENGKCSDPQAVQQFRNEAAALLGELKVRDIELRYEYAKEGIDSNRISELEGEIKELKGRIIAVADKLGIPPCCTV